MIRLALLVLLLFPSVSFGQGLFDWMGTEPAKAAAVDPVVDNSDLYALRPAGRHAYIVAVCSDATFALWPMRGELESKGWGVVRLEPKIKRSTSFVVIGDRITAFRNLPSNADLHRVVAQIARPSLTSKAMEITMFTRSPCSWCDRWFAEERPKAIAAGAIVKVLPATDNSKPVPYFQVCGADGYCRNFSGFTTFEGMLR